MKPEAWGVWHKHVHIRQQSSSGGAFSALAESILENGGIVFGALLYKDSQGRFDCRHVSCETKDSLEKIRGSKYVPSDLRGIFSEVYNNLKKGRQVLFCGTPCQVAGLRAFLGEENKLLVTVDVICHGVPAPFVFRKIVEENERAANMPVIDVNFRDKKQGWEKYNFTTHYADQTTSSTVGINSDFMKLFLSDLFLRHSCYSCQFKGHNYKSDITIGDFWGVDKYLDVGMEEKKDGVSILVLHTEQGKTLFERSSEKLTVKPVTMDYFQKNNIFYSKSSARPIGVGLYQFIITKCSFGNTKCLVAGTGRYLKKLGRLRDKYWKFPKEIIKRRNQIVAPSECYGCMACYDTCAKGAIEIVEDKMGFRYPQIDKEKCVNCGKCKTVCPRRKGEFRR